jgi:hypothetical protein
LLLVRHWHWIIGKTNLQWLVARLKALGGVCQFAAAKLWSNADERASDLLQIAVWRVSALAG